MLAQLFLLLLPQSFGQFEFKPVLKRIVIYSLINPVLDIMELMEIIKGRRSIRKFCNKPVPEDMLNKIIEAGRAAPSAGNLQARDFFIIENQEIKEQLVKAAHGQKFIAQASVAIVVCVNFESIESYGERGMELYCIQDSAAAVQNMLLMVHELGLGACWVGAFDEPPVTEVLKLPEHLRPVAIIPIGYPDQECQERSKRDDDIHIIK